jgi:hypothetical protein
MNPLDANPHQFRLVLRCRVRGASSPAYIVAESSRLDNILMHWSELSRLVDASASLGAPDDRVLFVVNKVAALLAEQDEGRGLPAIQEDDDVPEHAAALFRASFPALAAADPPERLISYYYGSLHTAAVPIKCTLFAGVASLALLFAPAGLRDPVALAWTDITSITKQSVLLLLDNAIRIVVSDGRQFVFVTVRRDDCYALLDQLWNNQIALLHKSVATRQLANRRPELAADDDNSSVDGADGGALTRHALDRARLHDSQRRALHIPPDEKIAYSFQCQLYVPPPKPGNVLGTCLVTSNALCFLSERTREISLVLPFTRITAIEETSSFIGIINTGFTVRTHLAAFKFSAFTRGEHLKQVHGQIALHTNKRASLPPPLAPGDPGVLIDRFGRRRWTATADGGGDLEFQAQQHQLEVLWAQYFVSNGVSSDLCVLRRKLELLDLARRGCPNELRANVWSVLSGAAFLSEREPGLFQRLLAERGSEPTKAAREIATDLNRSSNHPFFSRNPEAHESLRRVLVAFSLRNTAIGYCQGLNIIAAFLLLYMTEEETFWQLTWVAEVLLPGYFDPSLTGARVDQEVFAMLVQHYLPKLHKHLEKIDLTLNVISLAWFMVLFIGYVPDAASARVLDCLFVDGPDVLFQVALAKLSHVEQALLDSADMSVAMQRLRECEIDTETLLTLAYGRFGSLPHDRIDAVRTGQRLATARGLEQSVRDHAIYESLNEARGEFGDAVTRDEIAAQFDTFSSRISVTSNGSSIDFAAFQRCVRSLCVGMFDAEIVDEFEVIDGDDNDNNNNNNNNSSSSSVAASAASTTVEVGGTAAEVKEFGLREAFDGMSKVRHNAISFREFAALVCLLKFGTIEQQFRFWLRVAAGGGELLERAAVRRLVWTVLSLRFASIAVSDVDNLVQMVYHKAAFAALRASQAASLASGTLDVATIEELMLREKLLENFAKQMSQIYARRGEQRDAKADAEQLTIGESNEADDF